MKTYKTFKNYFLRNIFLGSVLFISLFSILSCSPSNQVTLLSGVGSNSVSPLVLGKNSLQTSTIFPYSYKNTGSGDGFRSQVSPKISADFGMTSSQKAPKKPSDVELWTSRRLRTLTFAIDAIAIVVNLPEGLSIKTGEKPIILLDKLASLYSSNEAKRTPITWADLLFNEVDSTSEVAKSKPIPLGIGGGKNTSGKSEAFVKKMGKISKSNGDTEAEIKENDIHKNLPDAVLQDDFNAIYNVNNQKDGSVMYYSLGQIQETESASSGSTNNLEICSIKKNATSAVELPSIANAQDGKYTWTRPFNIIYSTKNKKTVAIGNYLLSPDFQALVKSKGFVPLSLSQTKKQLPTWQPDLDYTLEEIVYKGINTDEAEGIKFGINL